MNFKDIFFQYSHFKYIINFLFSTVPKVLIKHTKFHFIDIAWINKGYLSHFYFNES